MNTHADIFFFVATIGHALFIVIGVIIAVYVVGIMKSVRIITKKLEKDVDIISDEARELILDVKDSAAYRMFFGRKPKRKTIAK